MEDDYMEMQDPSMSEMNRSGDGGDAGDMKDYNEGMYEENYEEDDGGNNYRANRGRGSFRSRGRGPPMGWMNGPPMRFRGRGYGPGGPPMRGRGFFRARGGPRFGPNGGPPNFDNNWGPMGPPPPGMMGCPPPFGPPPSMMPPGGPMGPPPNMMGQPPPFGGPPGGIPPPNMPAPEFWVEAKTDEGKAYYYHARTRETTWTRPQETPTLKVISQGEVEAMVAAGFPSGQVTNITVPPQTLAALNGGMPGPMGGPPMGMMPNSMMGGMIPPQNAQQQGAVPPYMGQPPPWMKEGQYDANKDKPEDVSQEVDDVPPGETMAIMQNTNNNMGGGYPVAGPGYNVGGPFPGGNQQQQQQQQQPPPQQQQHQQQGGYPGGGQQGGPGPATAGYGSWGGWGGGWPPQMVSQPPPNMAPQQMGENGGQTQMSTMPNEMQQQQPPPQQQQQQQQQTFPPPKPLKQGKHTTIPPELYAKASEWTSHKSPDGRFYYYNSARKESVWEKPKVLREYEELELKIAIENGERKIETIVIDDKPDEVDLLQAEEAAKAEIERQAAAELAEEKAREAAAEQEKLEREKAEKEKQEKEAAQKEKLKQDKRLPVSTIAISGTPWCVVWTGDGRVFFHNPTALSSVWERPAQLIGRADVDKAISTPPPMLAETLRKENKATATVTSTSEPSTSASKSNGDLKRSVDPSESDSDAEPPKKAKPDDDKKTSGTIDVGKEAAIEAEVRAARERGVVPHEQRLRSFQQMLHEKDVSAFSTWEKELHKIVFDPRYLMLNSKERRQVFDQYVRERAEEERKEKKNRLQQKKTAFKQLLDEAKLHSKSSYTEFSAKHGRDERFKAIEKPRDRENYFNEHIADVRRREKEEKEKKREQAKMDFIALLKEKAIDRHTRWVEAKKKIDTDPRYKAVEASGLKEDYFREYCKMVKEGKKKEKEGKEKDRSKKEKKDKDRDKESKREKKKEKAEKEKQPESTAREGAETEPTPEELAAAKEREARAQASIKEREREVQRALATSLRDRDKEREYHKRDEAVQHFNALLADLVRNPDLAWRDAKKQLKKDHRYSLAELLSKDDKERLFSQHTSALGTKRRDKLRALLNDLGVGCTSHWRDVKEQLSQDPTAPTYSSSSQMEREFREYQRDKQSTAKTALRQLLQETRAITHKSLAAVKDNSSAMQHLHDGLKQDARYLALEHISEERDQIIMSYLEELEKKGPPPPPTATEPTRRTKQ